MDSARPAPGPARTVADDPRRPEPDTACAPSRGEPRGGVAARILLAEVGDARIVDEVATVTIRGGACAVLDAAWPSPLREAAVESVRAASVAHGDLLLFTSGSSGRPRAVVRSLESWRASVAPAARLFRVGPGDVVWAPGSAASTLVLFAGWHALQVGARCVLSSDAPPTATHVHVVPAALPGVLAAWTSGALPRLRVVVTAGDRLPPEFAARVRAAGLALVEYYGAAELSFVAARSAPGPLHAFPGVELDVRDGLLWSRSPYQAYGYLDPADTGPLRRAADGWACVGDLARPDGDGVEIVGRAGSAVTTGGHTVVADDVEAHLRSLPGVADVAVAGVPHPRLGQRLVALVVRGDGDTPGCFRRGRPGRVDAPALRAGAAGLPPPARPRGWAFVEAVPRTDAGKVRRDLVAELALARFGAREDG